jgi:4-amino-4-deoxy-L-arabinose transferase-like glycosyltransferase
LIGLFFFFGLGLRPYLAPSEARYIELPRQMLATHDFVTPHINGVKYFEKPPLFYWIEAAQIKLFGLGEFSGRAPAAACMLLMCLAAYALGRGLTTRETGLAAAGVMATSLFAYAMSRMAVLDVPVSLFLTLTLGCFLAARRPQARRKAFWYYGMYIAAALAVLTKGLIGIVLPGLIIGAWIALTGQWRLLREARLPTGTLLFLLIAAPWHIIVQQRNPEWFDFYFIRQHFERFLTDEEKRLAPWWFFMAVALAGLLPWTAFLPAALKDAWRARKEPVTLFLLLWAFIPLVFFSASHSKLMPYILPIFPPLALLLGQALVSLPAERLRKAALWLGGLLLLAAVAGFFLPAIHAKRQLLVDTIRHQMQPLLMVMLVGAAMMLFACLRRFERLPLLLIVGLYAAVFDVTLNIASAQADVNSVKPAAEWLKTRLQPGDEVAAYQTYYQDLPVYLNRNVTVADWQGELLFGVAHQPEASNWMISGGELWSRCRAHPLYVLMKTKLYASLPQQPGCDLHPVYHDAQNTLLFNRP